MLAHDQAEEVAASSRISADGQTKQPSGALAFLLEFQTLLPERMHRAWGQSSAILYIL